jgi:hypothetical protein
VRVCVRRKPVKLGVVFVHEQNVAENCVACNQTARHEHLRSKWNPGESLKCGERVRTRLAVGADQYQHLTDVVAYATDRHLVAVQEPGAR